MYIHIYAYTYIHVYICTYIQLAFGTPRHRSLPFRCVAVGRQLDISIAAASGAVSAAAVSAKACPDPFWQLASNTLAFQTCLGAL